MKVKASQAARLMAAAIRAKTAPFLRGSPGGGKSQIVHQLAQEYQLELIDIRLSQCDPTDLSGFPMVKDGRAEYAPLRTIPIEGDELPKGKAGWLLFLDEANSAPRAVQAAAYKLILDRMVGNHRVHPRLAIALAGNLDTDGAITHQMSTALESRLIHFELEICPKEWDQWATAKGAIHHHITSFIKFMPAKLYTFSPDHTDMTYACPRTWEFADRLLKLPNVDDADLQPLLAGTVSEGVAFEFLKFRKHYQHLPTPEKILANPEKIEVPGEPSVLFALTGSLAQNIDKVTAPDLLKFIKRMPPEFQVVCMRDTVRRTPSMLAHPAIQEWMDSSAATLI